MKKVFVSFAAVAFMLAAVSCGNRGKKVEVEVDADAAVVEEVVDSVAAVADSTLAAADSVVAR